MKWRSVPHPFPYLSLSRQKQREISGNPGFKKTNKTTTTTKNWMPCHSALGGIIPKFRPTFVSMSPQMTWSVQRNVFCLVVWDVESRNLECVMFPLCWHSEAGSGLKNRIVMEREGAFKRLTDASLWSQFTTKSYFMNLCTLNPKIISLGWKASKTAFRRQLTPPTAKLMTLRQSEVGVVAVDSVWHVSLWKNPDHIGDESS